MPPQQTLDYGNNPAVVVLRYKAVSCTAASRVSVHLRIPCQLLLSRSLCHCPGAQYWQEKAEESDVSATSDFTTVVSSAASAKLPVSTHLTFSIVVVNRITLPLIHLLLSDSSG